MKLETTIATGFCTLQAAGFRPPKTYDSDRGLLDAVGVFALVLADLTEPEVGDAFTWWLFNRGPWFPTPAELRDAVPHLVESDRALKKLERGEGDHTARLILRHLGGRADGATFRQAFREYTRRWLATPTEERSCIADGRAVVNPAILAEPLTRRSVNFEPAQRRQLELKT